MSPVSFTAKGHPNIQATHPRTFEFTREDHCTLRGDCIVGVSANFSLAALKSLFSCKRIRIAMRCGSLEEIAHAEINPQFTDPMEFVVRIGEFISERTFATRADTSAAEFSPQFRIAIRNPEAMIQVTITPE